MKTREFINTTNDQIAKMLRYFYVLICCNILMCFRSTFIIDRLSFSTTRYRAADQQMVVNLQLSSDYDQT
jgi:hypothetical protein